MYKCELLFVSLGAKIKHYRLINGVSGRDLGRMIGVSQQQISRYENGVSPLSFYVLSEILKSLNLEESDMNIFFDDIKEYFLTSLNNK